MTTPHNIQLTNEQDNALQAMLLGKNVYVTGKGGSGKSLITSMFMRQTSRRVALLAPTGMAASNIENGSTIHSFFKFPINVHPSFLAQPTLHDHKLAETLDSIDTILIDEISMVSAALLDAIDLKLRSLIPQFQHLPFAGKQAIFLGDILQLISIRDPSLSYNQPHLVFESDTWRQLDLENIFLSRSLRQDDFEFVRCLDAIRYGGLTPAYEERFNQRFNPDYIEPMSCEDALKYVNDRCVKAYTPDCSTVTVCPTRCLVDAVNQSILNRLPGQPVCIEASGSCLDQCPAPQALFLKPGMRVMIVANKRDRNGGFEYVNGDLGTLVNITGSLEDPCALIELDRGKTVEVRRNRWLEYYHERQGGNVAVKEITCRQLPLNPGYCLTIHKVQSQTLNKINIRFGNKSLFSSGQLYCALSRVRAITGLTVDRLITKEDLKVDIKSFKFQRSIESALLRQKWLM